mmetsp:Transcript_11110/g.20088  ORF Transcript_11110/g.20088 Transcript_11110/m.20088 type:complete len:127 (-) Transcript_11110:233-613(-)
MRPVVNRIDASWSSLTRPRESPKRRANAELKRAPNREDDAISPSCDELRDELGMKADCCARNLSADDVDPMSKPNRNPALAARRNGGSHGFRNGEADGEEEDDDMWRVVQRELTGVDVVVVESNGD